MTALVLCVAAILASLAGLLLSRKAIKAMDDRLTVVEAVVVDLVDGEEAEPEDRLSRLHSAFRSKCRKAEGLEQ